jgi:glycosyltransferase involved in cell wall biosynthesis
VRKTAIIVPCYNEAARLKAASFIEEARKDPALHFVFVDDGSSDSTAEKLKAISAALPSQLHFMSLGKNRGKAEAVRLGMLKAFEGDYANIGYWDADLATPLDMIPVFAGILDSTDTTMVIGSRVRLLGRRIERNPMRHYLGRVFATFASLLLKIPIYDTQCGAKVFKMTETLRAAFAEPFRVKWTFDVELLARLAVMERAQGRPKPDELWIEYPLKVWADVKGSNVRYKDFFRGGLEFLKLFSLLYLPGVKGPYLRRLAGPWKAR